MVEDLLYLVELMSIAVGLWQHSSLFSWSFRTCKQKLVQYLTINLTMFSELQSVAVVSLARNTVD